MWRKKVGMWGREKWQTEERGNRERWESGKVKRRRRIKGGTERDGGEGKRERLSEKERREEQK